MLELLNLMIRAIKYMISTGVTFALEFLLLWVFTDYFNIYYLYSAVLAFIITVSFGYGINRLFVFQGSDRSHIFGYINFFLISLGGLGIVIGGLFLFVKVFEIYYLHARILVSIFTFTWTYSMNALVNFKEHHI